MVLCDGEGLKCPIERPSCLSDWAHIGQKLQVFNPNPWHLHGISWTTVTALAVKSPRSWWRSYNTLLTNQDQTLHYKHDNGASSILACWYTIPCSWRLRHAHTHQLLLVSLGLLGSACALPSVALEGTDTKACSCKGEISQLLLLPTSLVPP